ncbi:MAG: RNA-binding transcriptional accessory protein [Gammaproteobacteria bacterium]|nr:RNA-binding transcriptional accessory protein [Gammaproteobacteria bacterium]
MLSIEARIAQELNVKVAQVAAAAALLDEGATVPFISRYRKEATGGLDDTQLRQLTERLGYLRELEERRAYVLQSITEQNKLTPELNRDILDADTKTRLEDLYRPYMPKRRTKAQIAREAGLEPLAHTLLQDPTQNPGELALTFLSADKGVPDIKTALDGARQILMEEFSEDAALVGEMREFLTVHARCKTEVVPGKEQEGQKFSDYFQKSESLKDLPSHRALAIFRGRNEDILRFTLTLIENNEEINLSDTTTGEHKICARFNIRALGRPADAWLADTARFAWRVKISAHLETELKLQIKERAEAEAIKVFARNLHDLLMAAPAGPKVVIGLDPGFRTGVKIAVVDDTGKLLDTAVIYPHEPQNQWEKSQQIIAALSIKYSAQLISIGNGTASRETDRLVNDAIKRYPEMRVTKVVVSEAGASVYSASELAAKEFPELDVTLRGAVSIARRLQDPLAELVKIDPKSIGVGQYQHDVNQSQLARTLESVVEDCVNGVGVDVNTASVPLLARVSGLNQTLASNIVTFRDRNGAFKNRKQLKEVPRLGEKAFEQAAGFLRIIGGENPLDASAVHPEAYPVVERISAKTSRGLKELIGDGSFLRKLAAREFVDERFGEPTVVDIIKELEKPGRDPRPEFRTASLKEGVEDIGHLQPGMILEGTVTNVTNFGAFVDIGVHQDGLVHISALSEKFVKDPHEVVKAGEIVKVKVLEIDLPRRRIGLSMRLTDEVARESGAAQAKPSAASQAARGSKAAIQKNNKPSQPQQTAMAAAFAKLQSPK